MFGLLTRPTRSKKAPSPRRSVRLGLEGLEKRDCPSTLTLTAALTPANKLVTFSGQLTNAPNPGNQTVKLSGVASGTATTDAGGNFRITLPASGLGTERAAALDATAGITLQDPAPALVQFTATEGAACCWRLSGTVNSPYAGSLTVYLHGVPVDLDGKTIPVNPDGTFSQCFILNNQPSDNGAISATITDAWGVSSNTLSWLINQTGV